MAVRSFVLPRSQSATTITDARRVGSGLDAQKNNVIVFGNSYTLCGIDSDEVEKIPLELSRPAFVKVHALNGSYLCEWYWMARLHYLAAENKPDVIVLNVGKTSLRDRDRIEHRRLAMTFGPSALPVVPEFGNPSKIPEFLLSRFSMLVNRGRNIGEQINFKLIPDFESTQRTLIGRRDIDRSLSRGKQSDDATGNEKIPTVELMATFIDECRSAGITIVVVMMPQRDAYDIDGALTQLFDQSSDCVAVLDHRGFGRLAKQDFKDEVHLAAKGMSIYSPYYAKDLGRFLEEKFGSRQCDLRLIE